MHTTTLRKVGGSIMLAIPPVLLEQLQLQAMATVSLRLTHEGHLVVVPQVRPRYTLNELLAASDYSQDALQSDAERAWVNAPAVGGELL